MVFKTTSTNRSARGFTIVEFLVGSLIAVMLLGQVCALWFYSSRSFASQMAYVELDQNSQRALDMLSRDVRQVKSLSSFAPNRIVLVDVDDAPLEFRYHDANYLQADLRKTLVRIKNGRTQVLLRECDGLSFVMFQRTPQAGSYDYYPTTDITTCKMIEVRWNCSRKLFPTAPSTTESVQAAKIVLRSHKSLSSTPPPSILETTTTTTTTLLTQ